MPAPSCQMCGHVLADDSTRPTCPKCGAALHPVARPIAPPGAPHAAPSDSAFRVSPAAPFGAPPDASYAPPQDARFTPPVDRHAPQQPGWIRNGRNLRDVAAIQRSLLMMFLALLFLPLVGLFAAFDYPLFVLPLVFVYFGLALASIVQTTRLSRALGDPAAVQLLCVLLTFSPCLNSIFLLVLSHRANAALRQAGLRAGLLGVPDAEVVRQLSALRCPRCGFDLTGIPSPACPQCGTQPDAPQ